MAKVFETPVDLPEQYWKPIGEVISRAAILENQLRFLIWRCLRLDNKHGRVLTVGMQANVLMGLVRNLGNNSRLEARTKRKLISVAARSRKCFEARNDVAHGVWGYDPAEKRKKWRFLRMFDPQERFMPRAILKTPASIRKSALKMRRLSVRVEALIEELALRPLHKRPA